MAKNLVVVESPAKAKTLKKYLGKDFDILASYGHVRDLVPKEGAVDPSNGFAMRYQIIDKNAKHVAAIKKSLQGSSNIYLATDPDREGEAISWHLYELLRESKTLVKQNVYRVAFHEITKNAVRHAVDNPREISMDLVYSQQARRALDYLVGFNLSPLLWKKIRRGLSAGRVQSPALRMIVEREQEIEKFVSQEYWTIEAECSFADHKFNARLQILNNEKVQQFTITTEEQALAAKEQLLKQAQNKLTVAAIKKSQRKRNPAPPFTTSTLQQESVRKLGFSTQRTMRTAQQLYEGVDIGEGSIGLITYMRTDSVTLSQEALSSLRDVIKSKYSPSDLPDNPRVFKTKAKNVQEAHEAIRPTNPAYTPDKIKHKLSADQYKLYNLIWKRSIASQMKQAIINQVAIDLSCGDANSFRATGSTIHYPGFMKVYLEGNDDTKTSDKDEKLLPEMQEKDIVDLQSIKDQQHFTEPPPRYSEASLVKGLEEHGIGRPSTYASIISTLQAREYVLLEQKRFHPTDVGRIVNKFLTNYFAKYVDYDFTAQLEDGLDAIARGEKEWLPLLDNFWSPFIESIKSTQENVQRKDVTQEALDEACPKCQKPLSIRLGKRGRFIGCTAYPDCDYTRSLDEGREESLKPDVVEGRSCPKCDSELLIKKGKYGKFIGCSNYPKCKHIESLEKPEDMGVTCPECNKGSITKRKSRYGTYFYSCNRYPDCRYAIKNPPLNEKCPSCDWPILTLKETKRRGREKVCPQKNCGYTVKLEEDQPTS